MQNLICCTGQPQVLRETWKADEPEMEEDVYVCVQQYISHHCESTACGWTRAVTARAWEKH